MIKSVADQLVQINRTFYRDFAEAFSQSRYNPWQGFAQLQRHLPVPCARFLDVGCGDGRLGRFLRQQGGIESYYGVDFSTELLRVAGEKGEGQFWERDLLSAHALADIGQFQAIACLATLHHIPTHAYRLQLLRNVRGALAEEGRVIFANWQFWRNARQQSKIVAWETVGLSAHEIEAGDYLVAWRGGGQGVRYVHALDEEKMDELAREADMRVITQFYSDGQEGNLNLYTVLAI